MLLPVEKKLIDNWKAQGKSEAEMLGLLKRAREKMGTTGGSFITRAAATAENAPAASPEVQAKGTDVRENFSSINANIGEQSKIDEMKPSLGGLGEALVGGPIVTETVKAGYEGLKNFGTGAVEQLKEISGQDSDPDVKGEGFNQMVQGGLQTLFSPVSGILANTPGGDKIGEVLSKPREWVGDLWELAWKKAGKDTSDPAFQEGKQQIMTAFDVGTLVLPNTKAGKAVIDTTVKGAKAVITAPFKGVQYLTKEGFTKMSGLSTETMKTIVENPGKFKTLKDLGVDTARQNLFENVKTAIDDTITELGDTGSAYDTIRVAETPAPIPENYWVKVAEDLKVTPQLDLAGKLTGFIADSKSKIRSQADLAQLKNSLEPYWGKTELLPEEFLNYRSDLTNLSKFDSAKSTDLMNTAKDLRFNANEQIGGTIEGLRPLDAKYAAQIQYANKVKELIYDKKGNIKENALTTLANLTGKGKEFKLARLEEIMPEVAADVKALKALENIQLAPQNPVGQYGRGGMVAIAFGKALLGDVSALPLAFGLALTHPSIVSEFLRNFGEVKLKLSKVEVDGILAKIEEGSPLTAAEGVKISDLLSQITATDLVPFLAVESGTQPVDESANQ